MLPPEGLIRKATNFRLRRDSELEQRPGFTALDMTLYGAGNAEVHDLFSYDGRLFGIGNRSTNAVDNMTALYEYVGKAAGWRQVNRGMNLPFVTDVRELGGLPELQDGADSATFAVNNGIGVFAMANTGTDSVVHVFRCSDNSTLIVQDLSAMMRPVAMLAVSGVFHIVGVNAAGTTISARTLDATTDETFSVKSTLLTVDTQLFAAAPVLGSPGGYVIAGQLGADFIVRHFNDTHVQQMTRTVSSTFPLRLAIAANGPQNEITVAYLDFADNLVHTLTLNLATGATTGGGIHFSPATTSGQLSVKYFATTSTDTMLAAYITSTTPPKTFYKISGIELSLPAAQISSDVLGLDPTNLFTAPAAIAAGFLTGNADSQGVTALIGLPQAPLMFKDFGTAAASPRRLGSHVRDAVTGFYYLVTFTENLDGWQRAIVTEYRAEGIRRRQTATIGGLAYISGGLPVVTDGQSVNEVSWGEAPEISSLASSNGSGSVSVSARYFVQCHPEFVDGRGNVHIGPVSLVEEITTGAADDTITGVVKSSLHTLRRAPGSTNGSYRMVFFRTAALADKSAGENLYREQAVSIPIADAFGDSVAFTLILSDDALRAVGTTIYTQSQTPVQHQAPPPFGAVWPIRDRLAIAKLPRADQWLQSKLSFPGEAAEFSDSDLVQYQGRAEEELLGVVGLGGNLVGFTKRGIHLWQGDGPDHSGQGDFTYAGCLSREGGLVDADGWRSLIELDDGVFFQRETDQLCWLDKAGNVDWVGQAIRDELGTYPVVVAAAHLRKHHLVCFAIQNAAGDAGELLTYDLRRKQWFIDDVGVVDAITEYQGRLVYCTRAGAVFQQDALPGTGSMPTQTLDTFDFDFGTGQSWGAFCKVGILGEYRADATVTISVSYDSFATSPTLIETMAITAANGYTAGAPISVQKAPPIRDCERFALRVQVTGSSGSAGVRIQEITLETETAPGMSRLAARDTH